MILYHGGTIKIERPVCAFGRDNLDFGKGFYLTQFKDQAEQWARRQADARGEKPILNVYDFSHTKAIREFKYLKFTAYDNQWLHFIIDSRNGIKNWMQYDIIEGGIADDRVIDTVNLYMLGLMSEEMALSRLSEHRPNNQICILNQDLADKYLRFKNIIEL